MLVDQAERLLREAVRCALDDPRCPARAEDEDREVIYVDENGEVITDADGDEAYILDLSERRGASVKRLRVESATSPTIASRPPVSAYPRPWPRTSRPRASGRTGGSS